MTIAVCYVMPEQNPWYRPCIGLLLNDNIEVTCYYNSSITFTLCQGVQGALFIYRTYTFSFFFFFLFNHY